MKTTTQEIFEDNNSIYKILSAAIERAIYFGNGCSRPDPDQADDARSLAYQTILEMADQDLAAIKAAVEQVIRRFLGHSEWLETKSVNAETGEIEYKKQAITVSHSAKIIAFSTLTNDRSPRQVFEQAETAFGFFGDDDDQDLPPEREARLAAAQGALMRSCWGCDEQAVDEITQKQQKNIKYAIETGDMESVLVGSGAVSKILGISDRAVRSLADAGEIDKLLLSAGGAQVQYDQVSVFVNKIQRQHNVAEPREFLVLLYAAQQHINHAGSHVRRLTDDQLVEQAAAIADDIICAWEFYVENQNELPEYLVELIEEIEQEQHQLPLAA